MEDGRLVLDLLTEDAGTEQYCDAENLERLLRLLRLSHRPQLAPRAIEELPLFVATLQGLIMRGDDQQEMRDRLDRLLGYPARPNSGRQPSCPRMHPYWPAMLDALVQSSDLMWVGASKESVFFTLPNDVDLFISPPQSEPLLPPGDGRSDFFAIQQHTHLDSAQLTRRLWERAWAGAITNDHLATLRKGIETDFQPSDLPAARPTARRSLRNWQSTRPLLGRWHAVRAQQPDPDRLEQIEADKDRVRQVLSRYGVIFRELLRANCPRCGGHGCCRRCG